MIEVAGPRVIVHDPARRLHRAVMLVDGAFLAVVGAAQVTFELLGHYAGAGPFGAVFHGSPYTIGWVENHGFALLIGVLFLTVAANDGRRFWHGFALAVHVLLGAANVVFWNSFVTFDVVPMGLAATVVHALFIEVQFLCLVASRRASQGEENAGHRAGARPDRAGPAGRHVPGARCAPDDRLRRARTSRRVPRSAATRRPAPCSARTTSTSAWSCTARSTSWVWSSSARSCSGSCSRARPHGGADPVSRDLEEQDVAADVPQHVQQGPDRRLIRDRALQHGAPRVGPDGYLPEPATDQLGHRCGDRPGQSQSVSRRHNRLLLHAVDSAAPLRGRAPPGGRTTRVQPRRDRSGSAPGWTRQRVVCAHPGHRDPSPVALTSRPQRKQPATGRLASVQLTATGQADRPVFVGIARTTDIAGYLAGVAHDEVTEINGLAIGTRPVAGGRPPAPPVTRDSGSPRSAGPGARKSPGRSRTDAGLPW